MPPTLDAFYVLPFRMVAEAGRSGIAARRPPRLPQLSDSRPLCRRGRVNYAWRLRMYL